jgi:hypothetical protein
MSTTLVTNILKVIESNKEFGFYYNTESNNTESNDNDNKLIICYPVFIHLTKNKMIGIFSKDNLIDIKNKIVNYSIVSTCEFDKNEKVDTTVLYSFDLDKVIEFTDYSEDAWDKYSTCEGCRYNLSNQQGHTEYGGCLYTEEN